MSIKYILLATLVGSVMPFSGRIDVAKAVEAEDGRSNVGIESDELFAWINTLPISDDETRKNEVTLRVERDEGPYLVGEPIFARALLINGKDEPITIPWSLGSRGKIEFDIRGQDGRIIERIVHEMADADGARAITIPSNSKYIHLFDLKYHYAIVDSGRYQVKVFYESGGKYLETKPQGGLRWHPAWEGRLTFDLGMFEVVDPEKTVDIDALDRLRVPLRGSERKYRYALMFDVATRENPDFIKEYSTSRYTAYLLFEMAEGAMRRDQWRRQERAQRALEFLERIDMDDYPGLFRELVLHRMIVAHIGAGSDKDVVKPLVERFRVEFPGSPYELPDEAKGMLP